MSDLARKSLCDLIKQYGPSLGNDPKRCEGLLKDYCGEEKREILLIVNAAKEGIPEGLSGSQTNMPRELLVRNLIDRLQNNVGIEEKYAHWAVESWALALGVEFPEISIKSSESSTPTPPAPPIAPPEPPSTPTPRRGLNWKLVVGLGAVITLITVSINFLTRRDIPVSVPRDTPVSVPTESFALKLKGDYTQLNAYLKARDLENADRETFKVMLKVAGKKSENQGSFDTDEWANFSCLDLIEIDRLWNSLDKKYGFKYQSRAYVHFQNESNTYEFLGWRNVKITNDINFKYVDTNGVPIVKFDFSFPLALKWKDGGDQRFRRFVGGCYLDK